MHRPERIALFQHRPVLPAPPVSEGPVGELVHHHYEQRGRLGDYWINHNAKLSLGYYPKAKTAAYAFRPLNKLLFLFVISGRVTVAGQEVNTRDSLGLWETGSVSIEAAAGTRFLLIECPINH